MDKKLVSIILSALIVGIGAGYGLGYIMYQPQISRFQSEISVLRGDYDNLNTSFSQLRTAYAGLNLSYTKLQTAYILLSSLLNAHGCSFPIFPTYNFSFIGVLADQTLNETFMELKYSMGCEWFLVVTEFLVNKSMTIEEVNGTAMSYLSDWVENVLLGNMTLIDEKVIHGHVVLTYGIRSEDRKIYAWYCNVSGVLFIIWSEAYCGWTYEMVREVVESIDCH